MDDRRVLSASIFVNRNGLRWRDAPSEHGPAKTLYNRWKRWSDKGIFIRMMEVLATPQATERKTIMIDATYLKAHRTARSEEHTSELQSLMRISYAVFCLKKKNKTKTSHDIITTYNKQHHILHNNVVIINE